MKTPLCLFAAILLAGSLGCSMCAHPFDYSYAAFDEAHRSGHRAGSAFAPYSSESVVMPPTAPEIEPPDAVTEEEVFYYEG